MELQLEDDGTTLSIAGGSHSTPLLLGRTNVGTDPTISRRHLSLHIPQSDDLTASFEVIGKNPILVVRGRGGDRRIYRPKEKGELRDGDQFSLSLRNPRFYHVKEAGRGVREAVRRREERTSRRKGEVPLSGEVEGGIGELDLGFEALDVSQVDPVKDFGFLMRGHEFDEFPSSRLHSIRDWKWFLDSPKMDSVSSDEDEDLGEDTYKRKKAKMVKKRRAGYTDDDAWTGESDEESGSIAGVEHANKRKYSTRSHGRNKKSKEDSSLKSRNSKSVQEIEEDEEDETLGGFIVGDDDAEAEVEPDEEEEEDFNDDEEDL